MQPLLKSLDLDEYLTIGNIRNRCRRPAAFEHIRHSLGSYLCWKM